MHQICLAYPNVIINKDRKEDMISAALANSKINKFDWCFCITSPLCTVIYLKFKENTTRRYTNGHIDYSNNKVTKGIKPLKITISNCYVFEETCINRRWY